jgi:serine kinase of HPr protein (carbohydrate metabolism regulator)
VSVTLHATCVAIGGQGVLITGPSGSGKSDLALRLIDRGAELVSDDGTMVEARDGTLMARAGPNIAGRIEARGVGILALPHRASAKLALGIALDVVPERLPDDPLPTRRIEGIDLPCLALAPFEASAAFKVEQALRVYGLSA